MVGRNTSAWTSRRLARSVGYALEGASPFDPIPEGAECLVNRPILTTFRNPNEQEPGDASGLP